MSKIEKRYNVVAIGINMSKKNELTKKDRLEIKKVQEKIDKQLEKDNPNIKKPKNV